MTDYGETCRPDVYTTVYKMKVVLLTVVLYLFAGNMLCCTCSLTVRRVRASIVVMGKQ
jgi:hypothetical protein